MNDNLISINQFIEAARKQGAAFGDGNPKIHLAYLTKIGILPKCTKRKIAGELTGCYDKRLINRLINVEKMKVKGMTYSQISKSVNLQDMAVLSQNQENENGVEVLVNQFPKANLISTNSRNWVSNPSFLYLIIGILFGFLLSTLNFQGIAQMQKQSGLVFSNNLQANSLKSTQDSYGSIYVLSIPKQNLDKLDKTNINYLINN